MNEPITLGVVRGVSYGLFAPPDVVVSPARALGASLIRIYLYWSQVEPTPGRLDWRTVDALLDQLNGGEDVWITVCSSSTWGTRTPTDFQPPSPAVDDEAYTAFVTALVARCAGRVRYWQCNNEPSNTALLWAGSAEEYVHQLRSFARAVRSPDPSALVVLGGCGYDVLASPPNSPQRVFFDVLVRDGREWFDRFDVHLYGHPADIPSNLETVRSLMRSHGYERPVVVGEYNGPTPLEFPAATAALEQAMAAAFADGSAGRPGEMSTAGLRDQLVNETPDRRALRNLYGHRAHAPAELQMFMEDAPPDLVARRQRLGSRQLVQRALLALCSEVRVLACWNLAPEVAGYTDPYNVMGLMFSSLSLMDHEDGEIRLLRPQARTHQLLAAALRGAERVDRIPAGGPEVVVIRLSGPAITPRVVLWTWAEDPFDEAPDAREVVLEWAHTEVHAVDAHSATVPVGIDDERVRVRPSATPVFLSAERLRRDAFPAILNV